MKQLVAAILLIGFANANAGTVSYNGYTLDTDTNIVTGGGLEWLQWDETLGQSVNTALGNHGAQGWRVASNIEMSELLNAFSFGEVFDGIESTTQVSSSPDDGQKAAHFIALFGETAIASGAGYGDSERSQAFYGIDLDNDGLINATYIEHYLSTDGLLVADYGDANIVSYSANRAQFNTGVALVRVTGVPVPAAVWLFGSGLGLLGWVRRKT